MKNKKLLDNQLWIPRKERMSHMINWGWKIPAFYIFIKRHTGIPRDNWRAERLNSEDTSMAQQQHERCLSCGPPTPSSLSKVWWSIPVQWVQFSLVHYAYNLDCFHVPVITLHFRVIAVIFKLHQATNGNETLLAPCRVLVLHPGLFANLVAKGSLRPVSSESSLQGCFMPYQIDIMHKIISDVLCCIFRALCIFNEGLIPWLNLHQIIVWFLQKWSWVTLINGLSEEMGTRLIAESELGRIWTDVIRLSVSLKYFYGLIAHSESCKMNLPRWPSFGQKSLPQHARSCLTEPHTNRLFVSYWQEFQGILEEHVLTRGNK